MRSRRTSRTLTGLSALAVAASLFVVAPAAASAATPSKAAPAKAAPAKAAPSQGFTPVFPTRLLDSRPAGSTFPRGGGQTGSVVVTGVASVPASGVTAVVLNVTAIARDHATFVTAFPAGATRPAASNLNVAKGQTRANQVIAQVGAGGAVSFYLSSGVTYLLVDITGYFTTGSSFTGQSPVRVLDTRSGGGAPAAAGSSTAVQVAGQGGVPMSGVSAVVFNLTGISTAAATFVTAYPTGSARPPVSNLNLAARQTAAVLVIAQPDVNGQVTLYNSGGPTHLVVDVAGWFTGTADYHPITPYRRIDTRTGRTFHYGEDNSVSVAGSNGVPADAGAVVVSVTVIRPTADKGFATVRPDGLRPSTSTVNADHGAIVANLAVTQVSGQGRISVYDAEKGANFAVDVLGWFATDSALSVTTPSPQVAEVGQPFSFTPVTSGGLAPRTWTGSASSPGLSVSPTDGTVSGTPTTPGTFTPSMIVHDSSGESVIVQFPIKVYPFVSSTVWGWGVNEGKALDATDTSVLVPIQLSALTGLTQVATGLTNGYALKVNGTVQAWGAGSLGRIGNGSLTNVPASAPKTVSGLTGVTAIATGYQTTYALKSDGTVWAWGTGINGELGDSASHITAVPVRVSGLTGITAIGAATHAAYAVKADGTVWAWGNGSEGELGNNADTITRTPLQVPGLTHITAVTGGWHTSYALTDTGSVWAWGAGDDGELGDGSTVAMSGPVQVTGLTGIRQIGAGSTDAYAVTSDRHVVAWGRGDDFGLGNGDRANALTPVSIAGLSSIAQVGGGGLAGYALDTTGALWVWGGEIFGELGVGTPNSQVFETPHRAITPPLTQLATNPVTYMVFGLGAA